MTSPLGRIEKPEADQFKQSRKVYLVPLIIGSSEVLPGLDEKLEGYWRSAEEHIARLETALGPVNRVYHETVYFPGEEGEKLVEALNPQGYPLVRSRCQGGARLEATEDQALIEESADWQRCLSIGLVSQKVSSTALQAYLDVTKMRYEYITTRIDETLIEDESAILIIGDNHRVQFPQDINVFYVAPPSLNELRLWIEEQLRKGPNPEGPETQD